MCTFFCEGGGGGTAPSFPFLETDPRWFPNFSPLSLPSLFSPPLSPVIIFPSLLLSGEVEWARAHLIFLLPSPFYGVPGRRKRRRRKGGAHPRPISVFGERRVRANRTANFNIREKGRRGKGWMNVSFFSKKSLPVHCCKKRRFFKVVESRAVYDYFWISAMSARAISFPYSTFTTAERSRKTIFFSKVKLEKEGEMGAPFLSFLSEVGRRNLWTISS